MRKIYFSLVLLFVANMVFARTARIIIAPHPYSSGYDYYEIQYRVIEQSDVEDDEQQQQQGDEEGWITIDEIEASRGQNGEYLNTTYTLNNLTLGTRYEVRVRAYFKYADGRREEGVWGGTTTFTIESEDWNAEEENFVLPVYVNCGRFMFPPGYRSNSLANPDAMVLNEKQELPKDK